MLCWLNRFVNLSKKIIIVFDLCDFFLELVFIYCVRFIDVVFGLFL